MSISNAIENNGFKAKGWEQITGKFGKVSGYADISHAVHALLSKIEKITTGNGLPDHSKSNTWGPLSVAFERLAKELRKSDRWGRAQKQEKKVCAEYLVALKKRQDVLADWMANGLKGNQNQQAQAQPQPNPARQQAQPQPAQQQAQPQQQRQNPQRDQVVETPGRVNIREGEVGYDGGEAKPDNMQAEQEKLWAKEKKLIEKLDLLFGKAPASIKADVKKAKPSTLDAVRYMNAAEKKFNDTVGNGQPAGALATFEADLETMEMRFKISEKSKEISDRAQQLIKEVGRLNGYAYKSHEARGQVRSASIEKGFAGVLNKEAAEFAETVDRIYNVKDIKIRQARVAAENQAALV